MKFSNMTKRRLIGWLRTREGMGPLMDRSICTKLDIEVEDVPDLLAQMAEEKLISFTGGAREREIELLPESQPQNMARVLPEPIRIPAPAAKEQAPRASVAEPVEEATLRDGAAPPPQVPSMRLGIPVGFAASLDEAMAGVRRAAAAQPLPVFERGKKPLIGADIIRAAQAEGRDLGEFCSALLRIGFVEWKLQQEARLS